MAFFGPLAFSAIASCRSSAIKELHTPGRKNTADKSENQAVSYASRTLAAEQLLELVALELLELRLELVRLELLELLELAAIRAWPAGQLVPLELVALELAELR